MCLARCRWRRRSCGSPEPGTRITSGRTAGPGKNISNCQPTKSDRDDHVDDDDVDDDDVDDVYMSMCSRASHLWLDKSMK